MEGETLETIIVGEIGINHSGDINVAKQLIDVCSDLNIPYVKFQKRNIFSCYTKGQLDSYRESPFGTTFRQQKEGIEFSLDDYQEIDDYCISKGNINWFASPWDLWSIDFLKNKFPHIPFLKIPSAKLDDNTYLRQCRETNIPIIMSTGMSSLSDLNEPISCLGGIENIKYILGCTSSYPTPTKDVNLNQLKILNYYYGSNYRIGWSDHSGAILAPTIAVTLGARMVEIHITNSRMNYGTDQSASIEPQGLRKLVKQIEFVEQCMGEVIKEIKESEKQIIAKLRG